MSRLRVRLGVAVVALALFAGGIGSKFAQTYLEASATQQAAHDCEDAP